MDSHPPLKNPLPRPTARRPRVDRGWESFEFGRKGSRIGFEGLESMVGMQELAVYTLLAAAVVGIDTVCYAVDLASVRMQKAGLLGDGFVERMGAHIGC